MRSAHMQNRTMHKVIISILLLVIVTDAHPMHYLSFPYAHNSQVYPGQAIHPLPHSLGHHSQISRASYDDIALLNWRFHTNIVGGLPYPQTQWGSRLPNFFARIQIRVLPFYNNPATCGATVVGPNTLVSAAHCFKYPNSLQYIPLPFLFVPQIFVHVHIGSIDTDSKGTTVSIKEIRIPDAYDAGDRDGDIAVIILNDIIPAAVYEPIPVYPAPTDSAEGLTFGMGLSDADMSSSDFRQLRLARVAIQPPSGCRSNMLCSKTLSDTSGGLCKHDSGSPLLLFKEDRFLLVGISRAASPVDYLPKMKTHYYTPLTPYLDDLGTFIAGAVPSGWVKYTHGTRLQWDDDSDLI